MSIEHDATQLIDAALQQGVADIHLLPKEQESHLYFRVNGQLSYYQTVSTEWGNRLISYFKFLANMDVGERRRPQSGAIHLTIQDKPIELRFSTIANVHLLESLVIRLIHPHKQTSGTIHAFFQESVEQLTSLITRKSGLVLFSGPVGSGKTTTIYQLLRQRIQSETLQVITMEDPVEIIEPQFLQTEVNERAGIHYADLIKASLRHHPDVLFIGEIRDEETARMAVRGALTGHLMVATIHAKNTLGVIARLQELQITNEQLTQTLIGIVSQRLLPRFCSHCQGNCQPHCQHFPITQKRAVIFETLLGQTLSHYLQTQTLLPQFESLNSQMKRAWEDGLITEQTYHQFEIV